MLLTAPFQTNHSAIREIAGVSISIRRVGASSQVETDHPSAIRALQRYGFVEAGSTPPSPADDLLAWAAEVVRRKVPDVLGEARATEDVERIQAILDAESLRDAPRSTITEALTRRIASLRQNTST